MKKSSEERFKFCNLLFGVELEILLQVPEGAPWKRWGKLVSHLSKALNELTVPIPTEIVEDGDTSEYRSWAITTDGSIRQDRRTTFGFEMVSPITEHDFPTEWITEYLNLWRCILHKDYGLKAVSDDSCGTHVHVSPFLNQSWFDQAEGLKRIAKAIIYFERCVDSLVPEHRRNNIFCQSNRYNPRLRSRKISDILDEIDTVEDPVALAYLMCSDSATQMTCSRYYKWNFTSFTKAGAQRPRKTTVEFRQPPGVTDPDTAIAWTQFALAFVVGAMAAMGDDIEGGIDSTKDASMEALWRLIDVGASWKLDHGVDRLERLFDGKSILPDGPYSDQASGDFQALAAKVPKEDFIGHRMSSAIEDKVNRD